VAKRRLIRDGTTADEIMEMTRGEAPKHAAARGKQTRRKHRRRRARRTERAD
jgi:hypothetical protein